MYHVLLILLHRPFVADGHLYSTSRKISVNSFVTCATAASNITHLLRAYDKAFSVRKAPYLISYATYVAATIHARIAAKRERSSEAYSDLETCLAVFRDNQETNWAVRRANIVIQNLMKRLGVAKPRDDDELRIQNHSSHIIQSNEVGGANQPSGANDQARAYQGAGGGSVIQQGASESPSMGIPDIDDIIQSFLQEQKFSHAFGDGNVPTQNYADIRSELPQSIGAGRTYGEQGSTQVPNRHGPDSSQPHYTVDATNGWQQVPINIFDAAATVDDLLFGFNGSAHDSFPNLQWDDVVL